MCGIAGFLCKDPSRLGEAELRVMQKTLAHRGPDGEGRWIDGPELCGLAHRRLAIIDPEAGDQPMANEDGSVVVTFNGCIYNYQDLARELRGLGHVFRTHSDTEVIVHAWEQWGSECVERFNGMWAFALRDTRRDIVFCSRDRIGIKPLYWVFDGEVFAFASEIKALLAARLARARTSPDGFRQYLTFQFCLGDNTLFDDVHRLPPGHNLLVRPGCAPKVSPYWDIAFDIDETHDEQWFVDRLNWLLEDSVRLRLRSDVPLGAHLSGGLDSSAIVCMAADLLGDSPIKTFTGAFAEGELFDETRYAGIVAKEAGAELLETYLTPEHFRDSIEKIIWHMDEPAAGPGVFPQYWVSKLAADHVKVVLGGQGGDEIFIGYARYLVAYLEECLRGAIEDTAHRANYVATLETIVPSLPTLENYVPMLKSFWAGGLFGPPARRYFRLMNRFGSGRSLLSRELVGSFDGERTFQEFNELFGGSPAKAQINRILRFDLKAHVQSLLHVEDRTSMAWGLESRVPLLDHRLVELMSSVPPTIKFRYGRLKSLFRRAVGNIVPAPILARKDKMGFPVPLNRWLGGDLRSFVGDTLLSAGSRQRGLFDADAIDEAITAGEPFGRDIWGVLCLEIWHRQFLDDPSGLTPGERSESAAVEHAGG